MIRVLLEYRVKEGKEGEFSAAIARLRTRALEQPGYVMAETWAAAEDPSLWVVMSSWMSSELWQTWRDSSERNTIMTRMSALVSSPVRTSVLRHPGETRVHLGFPTAALLRPLATADSIAAAETPSGCKTQGASGWPGS